MFGVLVLAAGKGTRMRSKTPKVLHLMLEEPILYYPLKSALDAGFGETAVVVGYEGEAVEGWVRENFPESAIIWQREQRGTGHAAKLAQVRGSAPHKCHVTLRGPLFDDEEKRLANKLRPYTIAVLKGMLEISIGTPVSYMLAPLLAKDRDISIDESYGEPRTYKNTIEVELETAKGSVSLLATITEEGRQRIVRVNDYWVDFVPTGKLLIFQNHDRPGVIGKIGSILGEAGVNIANFALGRKEGSGLALGALEIDGETDDSLNGELIKSGDMVWVATVDFTKAG